MTAGTGFPTALQWLGNALVLLAAGYVVLLATLFVFQRRILFRPDPGPVLMARAEQPGLQEASLATADGLVLTAWYLPPASATAPVVLYLHGNAGHIGHRADRLQRFAAQGWGALFVGYRGYGGNPGTPSEQGLIADAIAGREHLLAGGIAPDRIVVWGESLGSGVATALAQNAPPAGAIVLETPFTSIADIARQRYPYAPVNLLLKDRFDSLARIPAIRAPILIVQGGQDTIVPPAMGRRLLAAATAPAELWLAEQGGHSNLAEFGMVEAAADFLARHLPTAPRPGDTSGP